jgi:hypothetical protein
MEIQTASKLEFVVLAYGPGKLGRLRCVMRFHPHNEQYARARAARLMAGGNVLGAAVVKMAFDPITGVECVEQCVLRVGQVPEGSGMLSVDAARRYDGGGDDLPPAA